tara:strand:- start:664 stop:1347 length:684 start_codon:yes stop_codon:yes gene_type:complete
MIPAFFRALNDLGSPRFRSILLQCTALSLATAIILWFAIRWGLNHTEFIGEFWIFGTWIETAVDLLGGIAAVVLLILLLPAFLGIYASLYIEAICRAVEAKHYPHLAPPRDQTIIEAVMTGLKFAVFLVAANLLLLTLFWLGPLYMAIAWAVNGYLLGREYLEMVGFRRMSPQELTNFRKSKRGSVFLPGLALAVVATIPIVNLLLPLFGTAMTLHVFEAKRDHEST